MTEMKVSIESVSKEMADSAHAKDDSKAMTNGKEIDDKEKKSGDQGWESRSGLRISHWIVI